ncbi:MAG: diphosphate--fructose-6-phosphate 1-phosphotransferase [Planctomycetota bacterium]
MTDINKPETQSNNHTLGILVGGGPAPGINGVISAAVIESIKHGWRVIGIMEGFRWLVGTGEVKTMPLVIEDISRIHQKGGSILKTSRENPTKDPKKVRNVVDNLLKLKIDRLITIGGDDTAYTASVIEKESKGRICIIHVPKTIDNDLPLPDNKPSFGFQTARHYGVELVQNIMEDAATTNRWYFIVTMGRKAGHLSLGIGKAAGATLTIIGEEFKDKTIKASQICDILEGSIIKRLAMGKENGVAILAEGLTDRLDPTEHELMGNVEKDEYGNIRFAEIDLGKFLKNEVRKRLQARGIKITIVHKDVGYELRCASPIPFDLEYTRDLGYGASKLLQNGVTGAMVSLQGGRIVPIYFPDIMDTATGKTRTTYVDVKSELFAVAQAYMIKLERSDFENPEQLERMAKVSKLAPEEFIRRFGWMKGV